MKTCRRSTHVISPPNQHGTEIRLSESSWRWDRLACQLGKGRAKGSFTRRGRSLYVAESRLGELRGLSNNHHDYRRLIRICEELNICSQHGCWTAVAALVRALIDHVPPLFSAAKFSEVANNYPGAKSFKESMARLSSSARKIGDAHCTCRYAGRKFCRRSSRSTFPQS